MPLNKENCVKYNKFDVVGLLSAGAMGLWHGVEYYEKERIVGEEFYQQWNNVSTAVILLNLGTMSILLLYTQNGNEKGIFHLQYLRMDETKN